MERQHPGIYDNHKFYESFVVHFRLLIFDFSFFNILLIKVLIQSFLGYLKLMCLIPENRAGNVITNVKTMWIFKEAFPKLVSY